jgi:hypothetical protein
LHHTSRASPTHRAGGAGRSAAGAPALTRAAATAPCLGGTADLRGEQRRPVPREPALLSTADELRLEPVALAGERVGELLAPHAGFAARGRGPVRALERLLRGGGPALELRAVRVEDIVAGHAEELKRRVGSGDARERTVTIERQRPAREGRVGREIEERRIELRGLDFWHFTYRAWEITNAATEAGSLFLQDVSEVSDGELKR